MTRFLSAEHFLEVENDNQGDRYDLGDSESVEPQNWLTDRLTAGAEYLLLRPSFSNATALYSNTRSGGTGAFTPYNSSLNALNYNFNYASGVRGFLGYRVSPDAMIRFSYMNLAATTAVLGTASGNFSGGNGTIILGPYATDALAPGGTIRSTMEMNIGVYDLEIAKRLDLAPETTGEPPLWDTAWGCGLQTTASRPQSIIKIQCPGQQIFW